MRGISVWVAAVGCAAVLAACTGTEPGAGSASPTPSAVATSAPASPSATATPAQTAPLLTGHGVSPGQTPPTRFASSLPHTSDGALGFAAYFYRALDWSIATTDPYLLKQISATTCIGCYKYINSMDAVEAAGGYSIGGRGTISELGLVQGDGRIKAEYTVEVMLTQTTQVVITTSRAAPVTYANDGRPETNFLYVSWAGAGWQAVEIGTP